MSMNAGDETVQAGTMARAIYDALEQLVDPSLSGEAARKRVAAAIAQGVVQHIREHAEAVVPSGGIISGMPPAERRFEID